MTQPIHFISDLHLCEEQQHLTELFFHYMQAIAPRSDTLYILGDFFEVWIGDDYVSNASTPSFYKSIIAELKNYSENHGKLFIGHGNRDLDFAQSVGAKLIEEPYFLNWQNQKIGLMHGDSLCTDDTEYQKFRLMVRNPEWQQHFLSQTIEQRLAIAQKLREESKQAQNNKTNEIMDVNQDSVKNWFEQTQCDWLIHGHTHREAKHSITLDNKNKVTRIVLSDWGKQGHYLKLDDSGSESIYFDLN
jgi:UDP-2,3-diacylglucosamine hydrolase